MNLPALKQAEPSAASLEQAMSGIASAISDPSRVRILCALMDGRAWTATELSAVAEIAASTASAHLTRLLKSGLVLCVSQGRHRYYRLAGSDVASLLESIMGLSVKNLPAPETRTPIKLRRARTCYDHLAGEIAVEIYDFLKSEGWIENDGNALTATGRLHFQKLGVEINPDARRKACCACLDWSERRFHLGGEAGAAMLSAFEQKGWLRRIQGYREVSVTEEGRRAFGRVFGIVAS